MSEPSALISAKLDEHLDELAQTIRGLRAQLRAARQRCEVLTDEQRELLRLVARSRAALADHEARERFTHELKAERDRLRETVVRLQRENRRLAADTARLEEALAEQRQRRVQAEDAADDALRLASELEALAARLDAELTAS